MVTHSLISATVSCSCVQQIYSNHVYIEFREEIPLNIHPNVFLLFSLSPSLREKYGKLYSMKVGSFKTVVAGDAASVKEVLVKKSADYAGRPPFHSFVMTTLGM